MLSYSKAIIPFFLFAVFIFLLNAASAQDRVAITGQIIDEHSGEPLEFANVSVMRPNDTSMVSGDATGENGNFEVSAEPGHYLIRVAYMGYNTHWQEITLQTEPKSLDPVYLTETGAEMDEFTIEAPAAMFESAIDRRIFDVSNTIVSQGGTALDLLETLPSIQVDEEGSISMRGSGEILVYINGRPTNITADDTESILEQFPSDAIERVELITNPSARYDAEGVGGIINIILKEDSREGFTARLTTSGSIGLQGNQADQQDVPAGPLPTYNPGIDLSYSTGNLSLSAGYSWQYRRPWEYSETFRENHAATGSAILDHEYSTMNYRQSHLIRASAEYGISEDHTVGLFANANIRPRDRERQYYIRYRNEDEELDSMYSRNLSEDRIGVNYETGGSYTWNIDDEHRLNTQLTYSYENQERIEYFEQDFINAQGEYVPEKRELQTYERPITSHMALLQADYERPLSERFKIETGLKSTVERQDRGQIFNLYENSFDDEDYETDDIITDEFRFDEDVHAAYFIFRDDPGALSYQIGIRGELTLTESYQPAIDSTHINNYFNLFPSLFVNYELGDNHDIQANYSRRISRPGMRNMQPFFNAQDLTHLRYGNPYLHPEFTDNYEVSYLRSWNSYFLSAAVYYRHTTDALTRVYENMGESASGRQVPAIFDAPGVRERFGDNATVRTWINANTERNLGMEFINEWEINSNTDVNLTANLFQSRVEGENAEGEEYVNSRFSWSLNAQGNLRIPDWFGVQISGNYRGPIVLPQGHIEPRYFVNIGLRRQILDEKGTISLSINDIFNSRNFTIISDERTFYQRRHFTRESQTLNLSFVYRFERLKEQPTAEELEREISR